MSQGFFSIQQTCPKCHGTGTYIPEPCGHCHGAGEVKETKTLEVKIPAGIDDGMRIRSSGNGEPGIHGGPSGDLYVEIHIKQHSVFERDRDNLHCQMPIPFTAAALGGEIDVPTLVAAQISPYRKARSRARRSGWVARVSRGCARALRETYMCMCRSKRRSSSLSSNAICSCT